MWTLALKKKKAKHFVKESLLTFSACKQHVVFTQAELRQTIIVQLKKGMLYENMKHFHGLHILKKRGV